MDALFNVSALTQRVAATTSASASVALPAAGQTVRIVNHGPNDAYVAIGTAAQTAVVPTGTPSASATPVLAGSDVTFSIASFGSVNNISAITATGTATLDVQVDGGM